jgi:hypothetical protein
MNREVAEFMIFLVEKIADRFFDGDQSAAYIAMKDSGLWSFFSDTYDTSHTLGVEYLVKDAETWFIRNGVAVASLSR